MGKGRTPTVTLTCEKCGALFHPWHAKRGARFCSRACAPQGRQPTLPDAVCKTCGVLFRPSIAARTYCSRPCYLAETNGRGLRADGYVRLWMPAHPRATRGRVSEHIVVAEKMLGRSLERYETVHHINGVRDDNRPENLQVRQGKHGVGWVHQCVDCGSRNIIQVPLASPTTQGGV